MAFCQGPLIELSPIKSGIEFQSYCKVATGSRHSEIDMIGLVNQASSLADIKEVFPKFTTPELLEAYVSIANTAPILAVRQECDVRTQIYKISS